MAGLIDQSGGALLDQSGGALLDQSGATTPETPQPPQQKKVTDVLVKKTDGDWISIVGPQGSSGDLIDDKKIRYTLTWSSEKINLELNKRALQSALTAHINDDTMHNPGQLVDGGASDSVYFWGIDGGAADSLASYFNRLDGGASV